MTQVGMATSKQISAYIGYFSLEPFVWLGNCGASDIRASSGWATSDSAADSFRCNARKHLVLSRSKWSPPKTDLPDRKRQDGLAVKYPPMMLTLKTQISKLDSTMTELDLELCRLIRGSVIGVTVPITNSLAGPEVKRITWLQPIIMWCGINHIHLPILHIIIARHLGLTFNKYRCVNTWLNYVPSQK